MRPPAVAVVRVLKHFEWDFRDIEEGVLHNQQTFASVISVDNQEVTAAAAPPDSTRYDPVGVDCSADTFEGFRSAHRGF